METPTKASSEPLSWKPPGEGSREKVGKVADYVVKGA